MEQLAGVAVLVLVIALFSLALGGGRSASEIRMRRRWDASFEDIRRVERTDATGVLRCRSCGASGSERGGRCPGCGAVL